MNNLLSPEKIEEIRLSAFLNCGYQRVFILSGEIGRMESEIEAMPKIPEGALVPDNVHSEQFQEYMNNVGRRIYISSLIGKAKSELNYLETQIQEQTQ